MHAFVDDTLLMHFIEVWNQVERHFKPFKESTLIICFRFIMIKMPEGAGPAKTPVVLMVKQLNKMYSEHLSV